jgi:hypothetical protein
MILNEWLLAGIFTLGSTELVALIAAAVIGGYLLKLIVDSFLKKKESDSDLLETELESLQQTYNVQMVQKQEEIKALSLEIKSAEQKNFDLQVEFAKALQHIETMKTSGDGTETESISAAHEINTTLESLRNRIHEQEQQALELNSLLAEKEAALVHLTNELENKVDAINNYKISIEQTAAENVLKREQLENELQTRELHIQEQQSQLEMVQKELSASKQLLSETKAQYELQSGTDAEELKAEILQLQTKLKLGSQSSSHKIVLEALKIEAGQVHTAMEQFRNYLSGTLIKTDEFEQLINKNEQLHHVIDQLLHEKQELQHTITGTEQRLLSIQKQQEEDTEQHRQQRERMEQLLQSSQEETNNSFATLKEDLNASIRLQQLLEKEKEALANQLQNLQQQALEKEHFMLQLIGTIREFEMRMQPVADGNTTIQQPGFALQQ